MYHPACLRETGCTFAGCALPTGKAPIEGKIPVRSWLKPWLPLGSFPLLVVPIIGYAWDTRSTWTLGTVQTATTAMFALSLYLVIAGLADLLPSFRGQSRRPDHYGTWTFVCLGATLACILVPPGFPMYGRTIPLFQAALACLLAMGMFFMLGLQRDTRRTRLGVAALLLSLFVTTVVVIPNSRPFRERANTRACYAQQKSLAGAIEMYGLDKGVKVTALDEPLYRALRSGGYFCAPSISDPGQPADSADHYKYVATGTSVTCVVHGQYLPDEKPRE
ncbi:MAG: hypothetical protein HY815_22385 [Candidatus Riflebacteria bacterium]|nr:hypothetical protein [Candidatus Riflebacteria bacterium]